MAVERYCLYFALCLALRTIRTLVERTKALMLRADPKAQPH